MRSLNAGLLASWWIPAKKPTNYLLVALAMVALLASCGARSEGTGVPAQSLPEQTSSSDDTDRDQGGSLEYESPIAEFLGIQTDFAGRDTQSEYEQQQREVERQIAICMRERGFEYIPVAYPDQTFFTFDSADRGSDEWIETYGFGVSTQAFSQAAVGPDLVGYDTEPPAPDFGEAEASPNSGIVDSLSDQEREAYQEALFGPRIEFGAGDETVVSGETIQEFFETNPGCQFVAQRALENGFGASEELQKVAAEFGDELRDLYERIDAHPKIVAWQREIADCLSAEGMVSAGLDDAIEHIRQRLSQLSGSSMPAGGPFAGIENPEDLSERQGNELISEWERLSPEDRAILGEIQTEEIALAIAFKDCGGEDPYNSDVYNEVRIELEEQFLANNKARLEPFQSD